MIAEDHSRLLQLVHSLAQFDVSVRPLPGLQPVGATDALARQMIDSIRRNRFVTVVVNRPISQDRADPNSTYFDPIRAAALRHREGETDEAFWLVFLATHFGKHRTAHWSTVRTVYAGQGSGGSWTWTRVGGNLTAFRDWLNNSEAVVPSKFGNHRKYESLAAWSDNGTGAIIESYVAWIAPPRTHLELLAELAKGRVRSPAALFDGLYTSMAAVRRFGRTARFDYCTMVAKLGLATLEPGHPYMRGATGPRRGASLLFTGDANSQVSVAELEQWSTDLGHFLGINMQVVEDALCNWQKSPIQFRSFRG